MVLDLGIGFYGTLVWDWISGKLVWGSVFRDEGLGLGFWDMGLRFLYDFGIGLRTKIDRVAQIWTFLQKYADVQINIQINPTKVG